MQYRKSRQRERILEVLQETDSHPTADWIYRKLKDEIPELSLGTVYRNLKVLMSQGLILKLPFGSTYDRYDGQTTPHSHLICERCGYVEDIELPEYSEMKEKIEKMSSFTVTHHRVDFLGLCKTCKNQNNQPTQRKGK
ncbi:MAG: transcriptional repressor [Chitinispirillaceae bacterium]